MPSQSNFLYTAGNEGANTHGANDLSYKGKRLALFDETTSEKPLNMEKIKRVTGGGLTMSVRGANDKAPTEFVWTALLMIGCNEGNMPRFKSTETALLNRMIVIPFRAKFDDDAVEAGEPYSYEVDPDIREKLFASRHAHLHFLLDAHARYKADKGLGKLPAGCTEWGQTVASSCDPQMEAFCEFIDTHVNFNLERKPEQRGQKVLGVVKRDELMKEAKSSYPDVFRSLSARDIKNVSDGAMKMRGRKLCQEVMFEGKRYTNVYKDCAWREKIKGVETPLF